MNLRSTKSSLQIVTLDETIKEMCQAETSQSDDGEDDDAVVAEEGEDKGEREQTEEDVGQEVEGRLKPLEQGWIF